MIDIFIPDDVRIIMNELGENGYKSYIVGGCLRDSILCRTPKDYDVCTNARPEEMLEVFKNFKIIETGIKHGTITVVLNENNYEVTTFRTDGNYSDNRHPDSVEFVDDIILDLSRRDFTINAMAYNYFDGLIDPFGGEKDLRMGTIKCVGVPDDRFKEDALRMLRAIRFSSNFDFSIDDKTFESIKNNSDLINNISKERINAEIIKILMSNNPANILMLHHSGLMKHTIPSLEKCFGVKQNNDFHKYDVGKHIIMSLLDSPKDLCIRVALMLHDVGKVDCKTTDGNGTDHFYQHEIKSCDIAQEWMREYKFDNDTIDKVSTLILYHDYFVDPSKKGIKKLLNAIGLDNTLKLLDIRVQDVKAQSEKHIASRLGKIEKIRKEIDEIVLKEEAFQIKDLVINGNDLMNIGFKQGVELGECLKYLLEIVIEFPDYNTKEKLLEIAKDKL